MLPTTLALIAGAATLMAAVAVNARRRVRADDRGEVTEKVIITALFAALALTVATIITLKVTDKAERVPTDTPSQQQGGGLGG